MTIRLAAFALCLFVSQLAIGQASPAEITNSDVISMTKAGIGEHTIILAIQRGPAKFDTSPQALIRLKEAGVSDQVLNEMLASDKATSRTSSDQQPNQTQNSTGNANPANSSDVARAASFRSECDSGNMDSCANLGFYYRMGWGVPEDPSQATTLIKKACDGGSAIGCRFQKVYSSSASPSEQNGIPTENASQGLTLKVLQEQSVPYTQESGGGISTSCNIVGTANTSAYVNTYGNSAYGNATTNSNQRMTCNSYDTTIRWPHVLNVMFVEASDGNSYIIACDAAWAWSKCVPLRAGDTFNARFTNRGLEVAAFDTKGKEKNPTYQILQSKSSR